jgi:hypothetical protein
MQVLQPVIIDVHFVLPVPVQLVGQLTVPQPPVTQLTSHAHDWSHAIVPRHALFAEQLTLHAAVPQVIPLHALVDEHVISHDLPIWQSMFVHAMFLWQSNVQAKPEGQLKLSQMPG